jgi:hypothetical protein
MTARQRRTTFVLTSTLLLTFVLSTIGPTVHLERRSAEVWMIPMPLGHELDVQHNRSGSWRVFWQTP